MQAFIISHMKTIKFPLKPTEFDRPQSMLCKSCVVIWDFDPLFAVYKSCRSCRSWITRLIDDEEHVRLFPPQAFINPNA